MHGGAPDFPRGSVAIYGEHLLLRSLAVLSDHAGAGLSIPPEVPELIAAVYGHGDVVSPSWAERARAAEDKWAADQRRREQRAEQFAIASPDGAPSLLELCRIGVGDPDDDDAALQAAVRDGEATVEVVLGWRTATPGYIRCADGIEVHLAESPNPKEVDAILSSTVRLPARVTSAALGLEVPASWQQHPWLRSQRLVSFDRDGKAEIGKYQVSYSAAMGLEVDGRGR